MRPILMPARARARRAAWPPGPGVLLPEPARTRRVNFLRTRGKDSTGQSRMKRTTCATKFDVKRVDALLFAPGGGVLGCEHGCVRRRFVAIGLDLHSTGHSSNGLAAAITSGQFSSDDSSNIAGCRGYSFLLQVW